MKVLVTGGAGFIGSHLIRRLLNEDNSVICVDNFTLGNKENIEEFFSNPKFKFYEININDVEVFCNKLMQEEIDTVYHLAANSDIQKGGKNPSVDHNDTFMTTCGVLELMRRKSIKNLFFSSTSAVYGDITDVRLKEDLGNLKPVSYYGAAKYASEAYISAYSYMNDFNTMIFRFPNVIGPDLTHGVIFDFINKLKSNPKELEILGDGTQTKPYIYVLDLIDAIMYMTRTYKSGVEIYNVGVDTATSVTRIADIVCEEMGYSNVKYKYTGGKVGWKGDVPIFQYDLTKIYNVGWKAVYNSDEAVRETVRNIRVSK